MMFFLTEKKYLLNPLLFNSYLSDPSHFYHDIILTGFTGCMFTAPQNKVKISSIFGQLFLKLILKFNNALSNSFFNPIYFKF